MQRNRKPMAPFILVMCGILWNLSVGSMAQQQQQASEQQAVFLLQTILKEYPDLAQELQYLLQKAQSIPDNVTDTLPAGVTLNPFLNLVLLEIRNLVKTTNESTSRPGGNPGVTGQSTATSVPGVNSNPAAIAMMGMQNQLVQDALRVVMEEMQNGKVVAAANNITTGDDLGSMLGLVNPLTVVQKLLSTHSANYIIPNVPNEPIHAQCHQDVVDTLDAVVVPKGWAIDMVDALGKPASGIEKGAFYFLGSYDQCYKIRPQIKEGDILGNRTQTQSRQFGTRFCRADIAIPGSLIKSLNVDTRGVRLKLTWGMCVPDTCHKDDIKGIFKLGMMNTLNLPVESVYCYEDVDISSDTSAIVALSILAVFGLLIFLGTVYDIIKANHTTKTELVKTINSRKSAQENGKYNNAYTVEPPGSIPDNKDSGANLPPAYMPHMEGSYYVNVKVATNGNHQLPTENESREQNTNARGGNETQQKKREPLLVSIILCFSLYTNVPKLLNAKSSSGAVSCIHGIRFLSLTWVVLGHTYNYGILSQDETFTAGNLLDFVPILQRFTYQGVIAGGFAVDTFFVLSAFLMTWLHLKETSQWKKKCNIPYGIMFYFHRFWRLTPIYMIVMMSFACLYQYLGSGPMWPSTIWGAENCKTTWWTNLLYINNLAEVDTQCMGWTWYLANDMQFYVISPIFLIAMYMSTKAGAILTGILMAAGIAITFWKEHIYNGNFFTMKSDDGGYWQNVYTVPWCRVSCWTVGMLFGLLVYKRGRKPLQSRILVWIGWLLATAVALFLVYSPYTENKEGGTDWTRVERAFYESVGRPMWGLCIAWVVFACYTGCGGLVNSILSWNGFIPLSRLTYAAYLVHPICMMVYVFSRRTLLYVNDYNIVYLYSGHLCVTFMVAFVCSLAFEAPFMSLEKVLFRGGRR